MSSPNDHGHDDPFAPPKEPIACFCLHCGEEFDSWQMVFRPHSPDERCESSGDWCCPTPGCNGVGFGFDIFPTDDDWRTDENDEDDLDCLDDPEDACGADFEFDGAVDGAIIDQFWRDDPTSLRPDCAPDELTIDSEGLDEHPLRKLLPPEELPADLVLREEDMPF
ncbi:MAG TPA: hypothetical protein PLD59_00805 [Tepidisphaeraceae bacterium]|mgnify:CR=1 FL=1|nr:hypothetical protein [Tepidisphaeraceae bacterium]